ncbi:MAG TPA: hypothetical protein VK483_02945 [Chitinophagaceae bacterium]|nr:hypothetical protein [Chitinophagaceae bacterium]
MLKKSLRLTSTILLLLFIYSCSDDKKLLLVENNNFIEHSFKNSIYDSTFISSGFYSDTLIDNTNFTNCTFQNHFGVKTIQNSKFTNSNFTNNGELNFLVSTLSNITFVNCNFNSFWIRNCKELNNLNIINCKIDELVLDQSSFNSILIEAYKDTIQKVRIQGCSNSRHIKFAGYFKEIIIEGGEIQYLDVSNILIPDAKLTIFSTILKNPNFVNKSAKNYSILYNSSIESATLTPDKNSILKEELEWQDKNSHSATETERKEIKKGYLVSKSVYTYLSKIFENEKRYDLSDYFYFRSKVCEREINSSGLSKTLLKYFNESVRGNYGTNYLIILKTFVFIILFFSLIYILLGFSKFAFGYYINTKLFGESLENQKPILLTFRRNKFGIIIFIWNCILFSLNNMVLGGLSSNFHFYNFTTMYLYPPRKYGTLGIGRFFSFIQSLIGLLLVFFFITAFLRLNR